MPQDTKDEYVCFGVEVSLSKKRHITGFWPKIQNQTITHHALVYFNDDFDGGGTRFIETVITPRPGRVALFQHKVRHEGCEVTRGTEYAMRTDVLYEAPDEIEMTLEP